ncbi:hypothetical protein EVAR_3556_1 [Eumeta japonica]|uniref:Uncharacterized protein n=1 Tax=Eumeta variegata TaxID=151549 RepID=A0A4C1SW80_EUMVA|nr:hypothetical protein EVAR_3556_1 [Eumeta japonica]
MLEEYIYLRLGSSSEPINVVIKDLPLWSGCKSRVQISTSKLRTVSEIENWIKIGNRIGVEIRGTTGAKLGTVAKSELNAGTRLGLTGK